MITVNGKYNTAKVFTNNIETECFDQIKSLLDQEAFQNVKVRIMPDCHTGVGCVIGFTADLGEKIIPNIVGVDIGCGMLTVTLGEEVIDFGKLDNIIREYIPFGRNVHKGRKMKFPKLQEMYCYRQLKDSKYLERAVGTLGGGNHFIEIDADEENNKYLVIHTGSRNLGKQVAELYQKTAVGLHSGKDELWREEKRIISEYKAAGRRCEIQNSLKELRRSFRTAKSDLPDELCYLYGEYSRKYLHDMKICQEFADENRKMIAKLIIDKYGLNPLDAFSTIHNYIDHDSNIIRKGAVSARKGEKLLIPINMRDGSLLCVGKGNADWNYSAPHGAGRLHSRNKAKLLFTVDEYEKTMRDAGIFTTSVNLSTLDECPMAYKEINEIVNNISETVEIVARLKPLYNFKADK